MLDELQPCNHEQASYRLLLQPYFSSQNGLRELSIITVDTDVIVNALYYFIFFLFHFISMSCGSNYVLINIRGILQYIKLFTLSVKNFVEQYRSGLRFQHSFAICRERETKKRRHLWGMLFCLLEWKIDTNSTTFSW